MARTVPTPRLVKNRRAETVSGDLDGGYDSRPAVAIITGYEGPESELYAALAHGAAEDNSVAPIMIAHTVKTTRAAIVESEALGSRDPIIAAGRFLASPKRERFVYNAALEAISFAQGRSRGEGK
ncbi:MAG: hypothetical protein ACE1ZX_04040 [Acidimicrobiia bacterium]|jgi:hypothetical protein